MKDSLNTIKETSTEVMNQGVKQIQGYNWKDLPMDLVDISIAFIAIFGIAKVLLTLYRGDDPKDLLMKTPYKTFNSLAVLSCLIEVVTLTAAANVRGIPFSSAFGGYVIFAFVEIATVFWVMDEVSVILKDGVVDKKDAKSLIKVFFTMILSFAVTTFIFFLYRESVGAVGILSTIANGWWDVWGVQFDVDQTVKLEGRAAGMIYSTQFFMIMGIIFEYKRLVGPAAEYRKNYVPGDPHKTISNKTEDKSLKGRKKELKELIRNSSGIVKEGFEEELKELEGNA